MDLHKTDSVFKLATKLCELISNDPMQSSSSTKNLRATVYEILLKKRVCPKENCLVLTNNDAISHLMAWQFTLAHDYNQLEHSNKLGECINKIEQSGLGENKVLQDMIHVLLALKKVPEQRNLAGTSFTNRTVSDHSFRSFDENSFKLPPEFSAVASSNKLSRDSFQLLPKRSRSKIISMLDTEPSSVSFVKTESSQNTNTLSDEGYGSPIKDLDDNNNIWQVASQTKFTTRRTWETLGDPHPSKELPFLTESGPHVNNLLQKMQSKLFLNVVLGNEEVKAKKRTIISAEEFIKDLKLLLVGIVSKTFRYKNHDKTADLELVEDVFIDGLSHKTVKSYSRDFIYSSSCYRGLNAMCEINNDNGQYKQPGYIYKELCDSIKRYLSYYRIAVFSLSPRMYLLKLDHHTRQFRMHIEVLASVCKVGPFFDNQLTKPLNGVELLNYLYRQVLSLTNKNVLMVLYSILYPCLQLYFSRFLQQWIYFGLVNDPYKEFFIISDNKYISATGRTYWTRSYSIQFDIIPEFLSELSEDILNCGKTMNLLQISHSNSSICTYLSGVKPELTCCLHTQQLQSIKQSNSQYNIDVLTHSGGKFSISTVLRKSLDENVVFLNLIAEKRAITYKRIQCQKIVEMEKRAEKKSEQMAILKENYLVAMKDKCREKSKELEREIQESEERFRIDHLHDELIKKEALDIIEHYNKLFEISDKRKEVIKKRIDKLKAIHLVLDNKPAKKSSQSKMHSSKSLDFLNANTENSSNSKEITVAVKIDEKLVEINKNDSEINRNVSDVDKNVSEVNKNVSEINRNVSEVSKNVFEINKNISGSLRQISESIDNKYSRLQSISEIIDNSEQNGQNGNNNNEINDNTKRSEINYNRSQIYDNKSDRNMNSLELNENKSEKTTKTTKINSNNRQFNRITTRKDLTDAQRNKLKVMSSEFDIIANPIDSNFNFHLQNTTKNTTIRAKNKLRVMSSDYQIRCDENEKILTANRAKSSVEVRDLEKNKNKLLQQREFGIVYDNIDRELLESSKTDLTLFKIKSSNELYFECNSDLSGDIKNGNLDDDQSLQTLFMRSLDNLNENYESNENFAKESGNIGDGLSLASSLYLDFKKVRKNPSIFAKFMQSPNFEFPKPMSTDCTPMSEISTLHTNEIFNTIPSTAATNFTDEEFDFTVEEKHKHQVYSVYSQNIPTATSVSDEDTKSITGNMLKIFCEESLAIPLRTQTLLANNDLLRYFFVDLNYFTHIKSFRSYFFLLDGEFGRNITEILFSSLYSAKSPLELINCRFLTNLIGDSLENSCRNQEMADCLSFKINYCPKVFNLQKVDVLDCISMVYKVKWPLNIVFPSELMLKYDDVFKFLVKLNRVSWVLKKIFLEFKILSKQVGKRFEFLTLSPQYQRLHQCRHVMMHFMQTYQNYIVGEVLQSSWFEFEKQLENVENLDRLFEVHLKYLKNIQFMCLLNQKAVKIREALTGIFTVILKFYEYLRSRQWDFDGMYFLHPNYYKLEQIYENFENFVKYLLKAGHKVASQGYQPQLFQFTDMLNINDYYSKKLVHSANSNNSISMETSTSSQ